MFVSPFREECIPHQAPAENKAATVTTAARNLTAGRELIGGGEGREENNSSGTSVASTAAGLRVSVASSTCAGSAEAISFGNSTIDTAVSDAGTADESSKVLTSTFGTSSVIASAAGTMACTGDISATVFTGSITGASSASAVTAPKFSAGKLPTASAVVLLCRISAATSASQ
jgi:hypothetical protein